MIDKELYQIYVVETLELLERFNQSILILEKEPDNEDALNELFRIAHNLKGTSGMVGYDDIKESMHAAEDLLDAARSGKLTITSTHCDQLLSLSDAVQRFIEDPNSDFTKEDWVDQLRAYLSPQGSGAGAAFIDPPLVLSATEKKEIGHCQEQGKIVYGFEMEFAPDAVFRSASAMLFFNALKEIGEVYKMVPTGKNLMEENYAKVKVVCIREAELTADELAKVSDLQQASHGVVGVTWRKWVYHPVEAKAEEHEAEKVADTIRVDSLKLQKLLNTVGDLISVRAGVNEVVDAKYPPEQAMKMIKAQMHHFNQTVANLQREVMQLRMVPIKQLFTRFPRIVRDLARKCGKEINLTASGESTEIDKKVMELLVDPMTHLIRNAVDHGVEDAEHRRACGKDPIGNIKLSAAQEGNNIVIEISDDGQGINAEKVLAKAKKVGIAHEDQTYTRAEIVEFIFMPGFSTADSITDVSGRGVGLDVVRNNLSMVNGTVEVISEEGCGTTFRLKMPLTLAIINAFLVRVDKQIYALPSHDVVENIVISPKDLHKAEGVSFIKLRNEVIPLQDANMLFYGKACPLSDRQPVVIIGNRQSKIGLIVEDFIEHREIMIKPFNAALEKVDYVSGVTILGNGQICLIVDTSMLISTDK